MRIPACQPSVFPKMQETHFQPSPGALQGKDGLMSLSGGRKGRQVVVPSWPGSFLLLAPCRQLRGLEGVEHEPLW